MDKEAETFADECALRFDYHGWIESEPGLQQRADKYSDACIEAREILEADLLLKMGSLFQLQRALKNWGLSREPYESPFFWVFYELVLDLYDKEVPEKWRRDGSNWDEFEDREAMAARVRKRHESIEYDWDLFV